MFLLVCLISGPAGAGCGEDSPSYVLQVHTVTSGEDGHNFVTDIWFLCHVATWTSHVATSIFTFSATSRRGFTRRDVNLYKPLSHRDIAPNVATSILHTSVTSRRGSPTSRRQFSPSLPRRDVDLHVAT